MKIMSIIYLIFLLYPTAIVFLFVVFILFYTRVAQDF